MNSHKLVNEYELIQKNQEFHRAKSPDIKPRNIFNPDATIKAIAGWMNFNLLKIVKS